MQPADLNARVVPDTFAPVVPVTNAPVPPPVTQDPTALPTPVPTVTPTVAPTGFPAIVTDSPTISPTDSPTSPAEFTIPPILETSTSEQRMHYIDMATGLFSPQCKVPPLQCTIFARLPSIACIVTHAMAHCPWLAHGRTATPLSE